MKSTNGWVDGGNGDNSSGFNALPGGYCNSNGDFNYMTVYGRFWSSSEYDADNAWSRSLNLDNSKVGRYLYGKYNGLSVRCLRD